MIPLVCLLLAASYEAEVHARREARETRLRAPDGWLSLAGLVWLQEGTAGFGSGPENAIRLPDGPPVAGRLLFHSGTVRLLTSDPGVTLNGSHVRQADLRADVDVVRVGRVTFFVIQRGDRWGIRVRDPQSEPRQSFRGLGYFPIDPSWRIEARFVPAPQKLAVPNVLGQSELLASPGYAEFTIRGQTHRLRPVSEGERMFFIFRDTTAGKGTYAAGRFLYTPPARNGKVVLDFNLAENPPCAFTPYATCPLPPRTNRLPIAIPAGERSYAGH